MSISEFYVKLLFLQTKNWLLIKVYQVKILFLAIYISEEGILKDVEHFN